MISTLQEKYMSQDNAFYQRYYAHFIIGMMMVIVVLMLILGLVIYQVIDRPVPSFTAVAPDNAQMSLEAFNEPNLLPDTILRFASKAATLGYTFDLYNYQDQLAAVRPYFTDAGWQDYLNSVQGLLDTIVKNQLFVNGVVSGTPVISNEGELPGKGYTWRVQIPFLVTYTSASSSSTRNFYVVLTLVRVPTNVNPQGIGVDQFLMM